MKVIKKAKVPIIKFVHTASGVQVRFPGAQLGCSSVGGEDITREYGRITWYGVDVRARRGESVFSRQREKKALLLPHFS